MQLSQITKVALLQAKKANDNNEVPVGAVIIDDQDKIIAKGHNNYRTWSNDQFCSPGCSCHAELHTLREVWQRFCRQKVSGQLKV